MEKVVIQIHIEITIPEEEKEGLQLAIDMAGMEEVLKASNEVLREDLKTVLNMDAVMDIKTEII